MDAETGALTFDRMAYLSAILEVLPDAVVVIDCHLGLVDINPAGLAMVGARSLDEISGHSQYKLVTADSLPIFQKLFQATIDGNGDPEMSVRIEITNLAGLNRVIACRMARLADLDGGNPGVVLTARDISVREMRERRLAEDEALIHAILEAVPDALVVIDEGGAITKFSAAAERLFGYREADLLGRNVSVLMPSPYREEHDGYIRRYVQTGEKRMIGVCRVVEGLRRDGTIFPLELTIGEATAGNRRAFTGFIRDLTDQQEAEATLQRVQADLAYASRLSLVGALASSLAHELNQPLTAITNYVSAGRDLLDKTPGPDIDMVRHALDEAARETVRAGQIVWRMRNCVTENEVDARSLSLGQLINDATTLGLVDARKNGIEWWVEIDPGVGNVLADRVNIQQVMVNLMRNAIKAMEHSATRHLIIRAEPHGADQVEISVSDTGSGIPGELMARLYDPFTGTTGKGMGLGLLICRTIIEAHGGKLSVQSDENGGTCFSFTLKSAPRDF